MDLPVGGWERKRMLVKERRRWGKSIAYEITITEVSPSGAYVRINDGYYWHVADDFIFIELLDEKPKAKK